MKIGKGKNEAKTAKAKKEKMHLKNRRVLGKRVWSEGRWVVMRRK
jgi:hypothetical protein